MAGSTSYPASADTFAKASPTYQDDPDTTGRVHSERHDDVEAAVEAIESYTITGTPHVGTSAPTNDALVWFDTGETTPTQPDAISPFLLMGS